MQRVLARTQPVFCGKGRENVEHLDTIFFKIHPSDISFTVGFRMRLPNRTQFSDPSDKEARQGLRSHGPNRRGLKQSLDGAEISNHRTILKASNTI